MNKRTLKLYFELMKPRILMLVLITAALGYFLGGRGIPSIWKFLMLMLGVACSCSGAGVLNHYLERDADSKMLRTKNRPLPLGLIAPANALAFGIILILTGVFVLCWQVNLLTAFLSLLSSFLYVLVYTPLKRISWLNTSLGAIPGALPPVGGWAAATGDLSLGAWVLFFIMFIWQHPHFFAIAWMFKEDYARGGFKMLPVVDPDGRSTFQQIYIFSLLLIPVSMLPTYLGMSGRFYMVGAFIMGLILLNIGQKLATTRSVASAKQLLKASVVYLPIVFLLIIVDRIF